MSGYCPQCCKLSSPCTFLFVKALAPPGQLCTKFLSVAAIELETDCHFISVVETRNQAGLPVLMALMESPRGEMLLYEIPPRLLYTNCSFSSSVSTLPVSQTMLSSDSIITVYRTALDDSMEFKTNHLHHTHPTRPLHPTQDFPRTYQTSPYIDPKSCSPLYVPSQPSASLPVAVLQTEWSLALGRKPHHVAYVDINKLANSLNVTRPATLPEAMNMSISVVESDTTDASVPAQQFPREQLYSQAIGRSIGRSILASRDDGAGTVLAQSDTPRPSHRWHTPAPIHPAPPCPEPLPTPEDSSTERKRRPAGRLAKRPREVKKKYRKGGSHYFQ